MQNPSQGVAQALLPHVHLISAHRFPVSQNLNLEQAFRYLIDAPSVVKQIAPMSWHYVSAPQDGTMWLEWLQHDPNQPEKPYPSDGYVWGDPEQIYRQEYSGYTVELKVHRIGFRPGFDQTASHARTRYHFVSKNHSVAAAPPDPSLWIVHYHSSDQGHMLPASQVPLAPQMQQAVAQRRWLEAQGRLERREFMLHDRDHWPNLNVPGSMQQPQYGAMAGMQNRYPQQASGPPAKKARTSGPSISLPGGSDTALETSVEMEEDTALGDFFDHLTQRDISIARYTQHHRWMEEVFSSPYASHQIVPADLGLGLMGELKGLTDGILEPPKVDLTDRSEKPPKPKEADPFTNLKKEQVQEFGKRIDKHIEEARAEIERMKAEHAAKMQDWKKVKTLTQAEKRLRFATLDAPESDASIFRLEDPPIGAQAEEFGKEKVDDVVAEVESLLKLRITPQQDSRRIAKGGLKDRKPPPISYEEQPNGSSLLNGMGEQLHGASPSTSTPGMTGSGGPAQTFHEDPTNASQIVAASSSKPSEPLGNNQAQAPIVQQPALHSEHDDIIGNSLDLPGIDMNDTLMDDIDLGDDDGNLNFDDATHGLVNDTPDHTPSAQTPLQPTIEASATHTTTPATDAPVVAETSINPPNAFVSNAKEQPSLPSQENVGADLANNSLGEPSGDSDLFNDDKDMFDGLGNIGDGGDDGLIDFDGGDMSLDDTAFGDALHGMDDPE